MSDLITTVEQLLEIADWWGELEEDLVPGTARRWYERPASDDELAAKKARDRAERLDRDEELRWGRTPPGRTASPAVDVVLDVKLRVELGVGGLHVLAFAAMSDGQLPAVKYSVPAGARWVADALPGLAGHPEVALQVVSDTRRLSWLVRYATGQQEPVMYLKADCPDCACRSLRAFPMREAVRCANPGCARVWAGKEQLAWLSRMIGGDSDPLPMDQLWGRSA